MTAFDAPKTTVTTRSAATGTGWLLATVCIAALVGYVSSIALSPFLLPIANELHLTVALVGQVPAVAMAAAAALGLVVGPLADHYGYRRTMLVGLLALVLGSWGTALAVGYGGLLLANVVSAGSQAIVPSVALAIVGTRIPPELRRRAISWVMAATAGANIVGLPLLTGVAALFDWRAAFVALGLLALVVTLVEVRALPLDEPKEGKLQLGTMLGAYRVVLRYRPTVLQVGSSFFRGLAAAFLVIYWGAYLLEVNRLTLPEVGLAYTATGFGFVLGSVVAGERLGRLPLRPLQVAAMLVTSLLLAGLVLLPLAPLAAVAEATLAFAAIAVTNVASTTLLANETRAGYATTMTFNQSLNGAGWAIGSSLGGLLIALGGYHALGVGILLTGTAGAILAWRSAPREEAARIVAAPPTNA